jgi:tRNA U54 and U55 pseudouridine synthase Pus10
MKKLMTRKTVLLTISLIFISLNASAQFNLLTSPRYYNEEIPKFCEKYKLPDSIKTRLTGIVLKFIEDKKAISKKYYGDDSSRHMIAPGSPFVIESKELQIRRDAQIENLLGKKMTNNLEMHLKEFSLKLKEEAIQNLKKKREEEKNKRE